MDTICKSGHDEATFQSNPVYSLSVLPSFISMQCMSPDSAPTRQTCQRTYDVSNKHE